MNITVKTQSGSVAGQVIFEEKEKKTLLELLREDQIYLDAPCNGNGSCGKCLVQYEKGSTKVTAAEQETLSAAQLQRGFRLACPCHRKMQWLYCKVQKRWQCRQSL